MFKRFSLICLILVVLVSPGALAGLPIWQEGEYYVSDDTVALYHFDEETGSWAYNEEGTASLDLNVSDFNSISKYGASALDCDEEEFWGATNDTLLDANTTPGGSIDFWFYTYVDMINGVGGRRHLLYHYADAAGNNGIEIMFNDAAQGADSGKIRVAVNIGGAVTNLLSTNTEWVAGDWNHFRFDWNVNGKFLYIDGVLNDTSAVGGWYAPGSDRNAFFCSNSGLAQRFDGKIDELLISSVDLNTNSGRINLNVFDENTSLPMITSDITFNGVEYSTDDDGYLLIDLIGEDVAFGEYVLEIGEDGNYGTRYFDVNYFGQGIDLEAFLLLDINGQNINFKFYDSDETTLLANAYVEVWHDLNFASSRKTNAAGETSFFLHADRNYYFSITKEDGDTVRYDRVLLTVKVPKDEDTLLQLTPFNVGQSGIGSTIWTALAADVSLYVFSNTMDYYIFDVNAGVSYYPRNYFLNIPGNPPTYSLQPYLIEVVDGISSTFTVRAGASSIGLEGIRIVSTKTIPGEGTVTVESIATDSAGEAVLSFISNDTYFIYFYQDSVLRYSIELRPTATTYQIYLDLQAYEIVTPLDAGFNVVFLPARGIAWVLADGNIDFNQTITVANTELSTVRVLIENGGTSIYDVTTDANADSASMFLEQEIVAAPLNSLASIKITVTITTTNGQTGVKTTQYNIVSDIASAQILPTLEAFASNIGVLGATILALFASLIVVGFAAMKITTDKSGLMFIGMGMLGLFTWLGWIPLGPFVLACLAGFAIYVVSRRLG